MKFPSRRGFGEELFNLVYFPIGEAQIAGTHDSLCLPRITGAHDDGGMLQRPDERDCAGDDGKR